MENSRRTQLGGPLAEGMTGEIEVELPNTKPPVKVKYTNLTNLVVGSKVDHWQGHSDQGFA